LLSRPHPHRFGARRAHLRQSASPKQDSL